MLGGAAVLFDGDVEGGVVAGARQRQVELTVCELGVKLPIASISPSPLRRSTQTS